MTTAEERDELAATSIAMVTAAYQLAAYDDGGLAGSTDDPFLDLLRGHLGGAAGALPSPEKLLALTIALALFGSALALEGAITGLFDSIEGAPEDSDRVAVVRDAMESIIQGAAASFRKTQGRGT